MIRLNTYWTHQACGHQYDYYFSSTIPKTMNFHLPDYVDKECKIQITFFTAKPNRIDVKQDGIYMVPTNGKHMGDKIEWERPRREIHLPTLDDQPGTNFFDRQEQAMHMVFETGHIYSLEVKSTLILELDVMTELTEDQFYDNGNIAKNIAALLGISPTRIKIVQVIRETSSQRRKRRAASGMFYTEYARGSRSADAESSALQFEIGGEDDDKPAAIAMSGEEWEKDAEKAKTEELNQVGAQLAQLATNEENPLGNVTTEAIKDDDPNATVGDIAVAQAIQAKTEEDLPAWFDPENPVGESIIMKAGLNEEDFVGGDGFNPEDLKKALLAQTGINLDELETAEETAQKKQEIEDKAAKPVVYKIPTTMVIISEPTELQIQDSPFSQSFVLRMLDQDGLEMETVGYAASPALAEISLASGETGEISGTLQAPFVSGDGRAIFNDLSVNNTDDNVAFSFSVTFPNFNITTIPESIDSSGVDVMEKMTEPEGPCDTVEGEGFDKKEMWDETCSRICTLPCQDFGGLLTTAPTCIERDSDACGTFSACGSNSTGKSSKNY